MIYLRSLSRKAGASASDAYPLSAPPLKALARIEFDRPVTLVCGDNGSGKTTLMELLAAKLSAVRIDGSVSGKADAFRAAEAAFAAVMARKPTRSFFFQAEDFVRYIDALRAMKEDARRAIEEAREAYADPTARGFAMMPHARTLGELDAMYAGDLGERSHGESFLSFLGARVASGGLYLLDEPEAALSPANQLVLMHLIADGVKGGGQFIVSTHSPVLLAYPDAAIFELRGGGVEPARYEDLDHIRFLRSFLKDPGGYTGRINI